MQLRNIQQQTAKCVKVYYECLLKLVNSLQVRTIDVFFTIVFKVGLLPYLRLIITSMKRNTLINHKEAIVICEESGHVSLSYNVLLTTPQANIVVKLVIPTVTSKSTLTCINCGKTSHLVETCHTMKRKVLVVPIVIVKFIEPIIETKTQPIKSRKIPTHYPCIICSSIEHRFKKCPRKI
jgi:hypothetical protein